jgi:hypothetical protein
MNSEKLKLNTMKRETYFTFLITFFISVNCYPQTDGPRDAMDAMYSAFGCLACPGVSWQDVTNISFADHQYAHVGLSGYPMCFQGTCYYSRILFAFGFGFNIPSGATILGVTADVNRLSTAAAGVKDSSVMLYSGNPVGLNHASSAFWTPNPLTATYGDSTDLWGYTLTADTINSSEFGLALIVMNNDTASQFPVASIDHITMTIYYAGTTGLQSQTAGASMLNVYYDSRGSLLNIISMSNADHVSLNVYDAIGQLVYENQHLSFISGKATLELPASSKGIYYAVVNSGSTRVSRKFSVE